MLTYAFSPDKDFLWGNPEGGVSGFSGWVAMAFSPLRVPPPENDSRPYAPRMWHGCNALAWWGMVARARGRINPRYLGIAFVASTVSCCHSVLTLLQDALLEPVKPRLDQDPVFIIGHWRTGTTLLHELLIEDPAHSYPTTYRCMDPNHFLLTEEWCKPYVGWMLPEKRPMDGMETGWEKPQEDEFALLMLGAPSPYRTIAFPNEPAWDSAELEIDSLPDRLRRRWERLFLRFLSHCQKARPGRMVLKSPTHTWRVPTLLRLFPRARFIHVVRDPFEIYPSTVHLWRALSRAHGMQKPRQELLEERVFEVFSHMHRRLEATRGLIPPGQWAECRYENLVANPLETIKDLYSRLNLGPLGGIEGRLAGVLASRAAYKPNKFKKMGEDLRQEIGRRWGGVITAQGYGDRGVSAENQPS